ncbi:Alpha-L-fucosidase 2 [Glycine soja]|uniref:Alpha-L-fucosidase 2 n=1 Tax=Glycine soja TaxID=3848 RepID=A0A445KYW5_GLYSO|nr:Alpha-L-fucosidase 2 [Glycine soja]
MKQMVGLHIMFLTYGVKHHQVKVRLYGQWVELGFVPIYGSIIRIHWTRIFLKIKHILCWKDVHHFCWIGLIEGCGGLLETNPSTSPEHMFTVLDRKTASVSYSSTMDISIIKEVFSMIIFVVEVLGRHNHTISAENF